MKYCDKTVEKQLLAIADRYVFSASETCWSMDSLAKEAGMSKNTLYKIVGTKEKLVARVLLARIRINQLQVLKHVDKETDFAAAFEQMVTRIAGAAALINEKVRALIGEFPALENVMVRERERITEMLKEKFVAAQVAGAISADADVEIFFKVCQSVMIYFIKHEPQALFEKRLNEALRMIISGIKKGS